MNAGHHAAQHLQAKRGEKPFLKGLNCRRDDGEPQQICGPGRRPKSLFIVAEFGSLAVMEPVFNAGKFF
jgi:hypothetical protein